MKKTCCKTCGNSVTKPLTNPTKQPTTKRPTTKAPVLSNFGCTNDKMSSCQSWAAKGYCTAKFVDYMKQNCCKACGSSATKSPSYSTKVLPQATTGTSLNQCLTNARLTNLGKCKRCLSSSQCGASPTTGAKMYCCPFMKKCIGNGDSCSTVPQIAGCRPMCHVEKFPFCKCGNQFPQKWPGYQCYSQFRPGSSSGSSSSQSACVDQNDVLHSMGVPATMTCTDVVRSNRQVCNQAGKICCAACRSSA